MRQKKGDSTTHILSDKGRKNFSEIKKACGHVLGEKCNCKSIGGIDNEIHIQVGIKAERESVG